MSKGESNMNDQFYVEIMQDLALKLETRQLNSQLIVGYIKNMIMKSKIYSLLLIQKKLNLLLLHIIIQIILVGYHIL